VIGGQVAMGAAKVDQFWDMAPVIWLSREKDLIDM
jgi:hypothetical protein